MTEQNLTAYQAKFFANYLSRRLPANDLTKLTASLQNARVDLTPHQIEAALFAFQSPLSKGAILADEVGLGKTIEAGIILSQNWAEHKRHLLIICPANLRKQWSCELQEKFFLPSIILEKKSFNEQIEQGNLNPFNQDEAIVICSFQFAKTKASYIKQTSWHLAVIDEAHRLRNVYKPANVIANTIKSALADRRKILMTATPLQNSILELFGLVSIVDDFVFGDIKSFKERFGNMQSESEFQVLRRRLEPVCKRTLRRQVLEYIRYTKRIAILEEFSPYKDEEALYEMVSGYLQRTQLYALPNSQRMLMSLILRKLLASSTYAIHGTLCSLIERLEAMLARQSALESVSVSEDFEDTINEDEWIDEDELNESEDDDGGMIFHPTDIEGIKNEISELKTFRDLAFKIKRNSKAEHLFKALAKGFEKMKELGALQKALIFTESRRTQEYLYELLEERGYKGKVVRFNGTNTDRQSTIIYKVWLEKNKDCGKATGSPTADRRAAIVDFFREEATIMIATEAAAEGINLQFCSLIVNYDMPWNPQRIEQRIGRCHRYGQQFDVVVINFLNIKNEADIRVYQLLSEKFQLFDGIFGASDEVLGTIGNGVDFEKRIADIYNSCRTPQAIKQAFDELQSEFQERISDNMLAARSSLLENFDEEVAQKLRVNFKESAASLTKFNKALWLLTRYALHATARFDESNASFLMFDTSIKDYAGRYYLLNTGTSSRRSQLSIPVHTQVYRVGHPLARHIITEFIDADLPCREVVFDYTNTPIRVALPGELVGKSGWLHAEKLSINAFEQEDRLLIACFDEQGNEVYPDVAEYMFELYATEQAGAVIKPAIVINQYNSIIARQRTAIIGRNAQRNQNIFEEEMDKLDAWAEDMKMSLERELQDLDTEIKLLKGSARKLATLEEKVKAQRTIKELEHRRAEKRQNLFTSQDEVDASKEELLSSVERMLNQKVEQKDLFTIKWKIV
ncbi:MAG: DEAD/DEAH box helicase family protein [Prevotella sp.]|nr:DEAD/DEAH box helicase family protein [Prevotella sp.]